MNKMEKYANANTVPSLAHLHSEHLLLGLNELRQSNQLCDVVLRTGDVKIQAHKVVLASCSPYFRAMFTSNLSEKEKTEIELKSVDAMALNTLVDFAYTGELFISQANIQSLLPVANLLQLRSVIDECCAFLQTQLHPSNCIGIARFAEMHSCFDLYTQCTKYLLKHFNDVLETEEFLQLSFSEAMDILSSDELNVVNEETVFKAIESWVEYEPKQRQTYLHKLLKCLRLPQLSVGFLKKCIDKCELLEDDLSSRELFNEGLEYKLNAHLRLSKTDISSKGHLVSRPRCAPKVLCAVGGKNGLFVTLDSVEVYIPQNDTWTEVSPLPVRRSECGVAVLDRKLYVIGGILTESQGGVAYRRHTTSVDCWNPDINKWTSVAPLGITRSALGVSVMDGCIYATGGYDGNTYQRSVERYCPKSNQWEPLSSMSLNRSCFSTITLDGYLYAVGGYGPPCLNSVEKYDPVNDTWEMTAAMSEKRINFGIGVSCGFIFVVGGNSGGTHLSSVERYDPEAYQWTMVASMDMPRTGLRVVVIDDKLYAVGGHSGAAYLNLVQCYDPKTDEWCDLCNMKDCRCSFGLAGL